MRRVRIPVMTAAVVLVVGVVAALILWPRAGADSAGQAHDASSMAQTLAGPATTTDSSTGTGLSTSTASSIDTVTVAPLSSPSESTPSVMTPFAAASPPSHPSLPPTSTRTSSPTPATSSPTSAPAISAFASASSTSTPAGTTSYEAQGPRQVFASTTGTASSGTTSSGTASSGTASSGTASSGTTSSGTTSSPPTTRATTPALPFAIPVDPGTATQLVTVTADSHSATTGTLRAWEKRAGAWHLVYGPFTAELGRGGIGQASEYHPRTPQGTFTLTHAFGRLADPGTALPYHRTAPDDWWVSDVDSRAYNTLETCAKADCSFDTGVSEHLYYITPYYDYAVVMDANMNPVTPGGGSAFFLHVSVGKPTAGCIAIDKDALVRVMRWLDPAAHPRIATGISGGA